MKKLLSVFLIVFTIIPVCAVSSEIAFGTSKINISDSGKITISDSRFGEWLTNGNFGISEKPVKVQLVDNSRRAQIEFKNGKSTSIGFDEDGAVRISCGFRFTADVIWGSEPILCRIAPPKDVKVAFLSSGQVSNLAANALFDPASDSAVCMEGIGQWQPAAKGQYKLQASFDIVLRIHQDYYKKTRNIPFYKPLDRTRFDRPPAGWCSWYFYAESITEDEMVKNIDWIAENLKRFGCEYVQLDDGFQTDSWTTWNAKFPHGGKWLADYIHSKGLKAGLWLAPFATNEKELFEKHPDWFIVRDGQPVETFKGKYTIDTTNPAVIDGWLKPLYRTLALDWNYDYFKQDGQPIVIWEYSRSDFYKKGANYVDAYREGLKSIREIIGKDRIMLSCWGLVLDGAGIIDASRTGIDVAAWWPAVGQLTEPTRECLYLNNIVLFADPDVVFARDDLTLDQARIWASIVALTGQLYMASDKMYVLPDERVEIYRRTYPVCLMLPNDLYPLTHEQMKTIDLKVSRPFGNWDVVGLFNWSYKEQQYKVPFSELGLPDDTYILYDFWNKRLIGRMTGAIEMSVIPTSCRILAVHRDENRPQVVSTSRHITQGAMDLKDVKWDAERMTLSGVSSVVGNDPYEVRIAIPVSTNTYRAVSCSAKGASAEISKADGLVILTLKTGTNRDVSWSVRFTKDAADTISPARPFKLEASTERSDTIELSWTAVDDNIGVAKYIILRDGVEIDSVIASDKPSYIDRRVSPGTTYTYKIQAVDFAGLKSKPTLPAIAKTLPAKSGYITMIRPFSNDQKYGELRFDRSVDNQSITIAGEKYTHGIGTHAFSEVNYYLGRGYSTFKSFVGIDDEIKPKGTAIFRVIGDGEVLYDSGLMKSGDPAREVSVDVSDVEMMSLVVLDGGDGTAEDHADWAEARLEAK